MSYFHPFRSFVKVDKILNNSKAVRNNFKLSALLLELELQSGGNISFEEVEKENLSESGNNELPTGKNKRQI